MRSLVDAMDITKTSRRSRFHCRGRLYRVVFGCLAICLSLALWSLTDNTFILARKKTRIGAPTMEGVYGISIPYEISPTPINTTSGLLGLARKFDESGEAEIAIAIYRTLLNRFKTEDADISHTRRIALLYLCHYRISRSYLLLNEPEQALLHANKAFQIRPRREPFYHVARFFDEQRHNESMALQYYNLAAGVPIPPADAPFGEAEVYAVDIERDILWPRAFPQDYLLQLSEYQNILDNSDADDETYARMHDEMILISRALFAAGYEELFRKEGPFRPKEPDNEFYYSTPTIVRVHPDRADDFLIVCRLINYRIDPVGRWYRDFLPSGTSSHSLKSGMALHRGIHDDKGILVTISDDSLNKSTSDVIGPEDPKMLRVYRQGSQNGTIELIMTSWEYSKIAGDGSRMASGTLYPERGVLEMKHAFSSPNNRFWEKNWVMFQIPGHQDTHVHFVYEWHPLRIGTLGDEKEHVIEFHTAIDTPRSFKFLRGSSNGAVYRREIWFMVHGVGKIGHIYYHKIVVLDAQTLHVRRHSYPFKLEGPLHTEFCLGLDIDGENETMTIAYSVLDGSSVLRRIALWKLEALMMN